MVLGLINILLHICLYSLVMVIWRTITFFYSNYIYCLWLVEAARMPRCFVIISGWKWEQCSWTKRKNSLHKDAAQNCIPNLQSGVKKMSDDFHTHSLLTFALPEALRFMNSSLTRLKVPRRTSVSLCFLLYVWNGTERVVRWSPGEETTEKTISYSISYWGREGSQGCFEHFGFALEVKLFWFQRCSIH